MLKKALGVLSWPSALGKGRQSPLPTVPQGKENLFVALAFVLCLGIGLSLLPQYFRWEGAKEQKQMWLLRREQTPPPLKEVLIPGAQDLPAIIEQAVQVFLKEQVGVRSFNVERFGDANRNETSALNFATVRLKLKGSWAGIQKGLITLEALPGPVFRVQEVKLAQEGGDILLKLYFAEPDNPIHP